MTWRKVVGFGFLVWLIPFGVSLFFFTAEGELAVDKFLFKSVMLVLGGALGAFLLTRLFGEVQGDYVRAGLVIGWVWFGLNIALDGVVLVALFGGGVREYVYEVGLRYLLMPITSLAIGVALAQAAARGERA